jgi:hypothetical protein
LYQSHNGRTKTGYQRSYIFVLTCITLFGFGKDACCLFHFEDMAEPQVDKGIIYSRHTYILWKLTQKDCWNKSHRMRKFMHHLKVILVDIYGFDWAYLVATATINATVFLDGSGAL